MAERIRPNSHFDPKYSPELIARVHESAGQGGTRTAIAKLCNVSPQTLTGWCSPSSRYYHEEFAEAVKMVQELCGDNVEASVYQRAVGYVYKEDVVLRDGKTVQVSKRMHSDMKAAEMYLNNKRGWATHSQVETEVTVNAKIRESLAGRMRRVREQLGGDPSVSDPARAGLPPVRLEVLGEAGPTPPEGELAQVADNGGEGVRQDPVGSGVDQGAGQDE
jgi:hypothetical protein